MSPQRHRTLEHKRQYGLHKKNHPERKFSQGGQWLRSRLPDSTRLVRVKIPFRKAQVPLSARQRKLREREKRRKERSDQPSPATQALRKALSWKEEITAGLATRASIARREGITRARVTQVMSLLRLPLPVQQMLRDDHAEIRDWSIRRALRTVPRAPQ